MEGRFYNAQQMKYVSAKRADIINYAPTKDVAFNKS